MSVDSLHKQNALNAELEKLKQQNGLLSSDLKKAKSILAGIKNKDQVGNHSVNRIESNHKTQSQYSHVTVTSHQIDCLELFLSFFVLMYVCV